jgi:hypothetical protein
VGDPQVTVMGGSNPYVAVVQQYKGEKGATATVTSFAATNDGQRESGTFIATDDGHGTQHEELQTSSGGVTRSETRHPDGSTDTFERHADGSTTTASSKDGVTQITHTDKDGNVTTATVKENGDCTGTACQVSMPADETGASDGCHLPLGRSGGPRRGNLIDPIGPYIYPEPDSPSRSPLLACVRQSIGEGSTTPSCPPSVVLCLEPPPFGSCGCSMPLPGGGPRPEDVCSQIQCADGSSCDPQTGACRGPSQDGLGGAFSPGAQPFPRPSAIILRP